MAVTIWHNPRCSKSRETLQLLRDRGVEPVVRLYLQNPPSAGEIAKALKQLDIGAEGLVRRGEKAFGELGLAGRPDGELIAAMVKHPVLIERPVVFGPKGAAIGRPPENVLKVL